MNKKITTSLLIFFTFTLFFSGCSPPIAKNQLQFGIKAAQRDLWDEAIFRWENIIRSNPDSAAAHNNLAVAYEKKGLFDEAKKEYEIAIKIDPKNKYIISNYEKYLKNQNEKTEEKNEKQ